MGLWVEIVVAAFGAIVVPLLGFFWTRLERVQRDFADYKVQVAMEFATYKALDATEQRILRELGEVKELLRFLIQGQPEWPQHQSKPSS